MHPIVDRELFVEQVRLRDFRMTDHYRKKVESRQLVEHDEVEGMLSDFSCLKAFTYKRDLKDNERYNVLFDKSNKYYLLVALSFVNNHINLVTAFVTRKDRGRPEELVSRWG